MSYIGDAATDSWNLQQWSGLERHMRRMLPHLAANDRWMDQYSAWLELQGIKTDGDDGWPTAAFYDEKHVAEFIRLNAQPPDEASGR